MRWPPRASCRGRSTRFWCWAARPGCSAARRRSARCSETTVVTAFAAWYIAFRDIRLSTRFTLFVELATLLLIAVVVVGTIAFGGHPVDRAQLTLEGVKPTQLQLGMVLAFFSFTGFESATVLGAEARDPFRAIPRAVLISVVGPAILFVIGAYGMVSAFHGRRRRSIRSMARSRCSRIGSGPAGSAC